MARIRSTKPEFYLDPDVQALSIPARFLFQGMWNQADDRGRLLDNPTLICAQVFAPHDKVKPEGLIAELADGREPRILRYQARGKRIIAIRAFRLHQNISKPQESRLPGPPLSSATAMFQGWTREEWTEHSTTSSGVVPLPGAEQEPGHSVLELEWSGGGVRSGDGGGVESVAPDKPARVRNPTFDALCEACGMNPDGLTAEEAKRVGVAAARLVNLKPTPTPTEIRTRAANWPSVMGDATMTPNAITTNWGRLNGVPRSSGRPPSAIERTIAGAYEEVDRGEEPSEGAGGVSRRSLPS